MSGIDFEFSVQSEVDRVRTQKPAAPAKAKGKGKPSRSGSQTAAKPAESAPAPPPGAGHTGNSDKPVVKTSKPQETEAKPAPEPTSVAAAEPEGLQVEQSQQETPGAVGAQDGGSTIIDRKQFRGLPGIFNYVGGHNIYELANDIKRSSLTGMPDSLISAVQKSLRERFMGARVQFRWGKHEITADNRVFQTKASLARYMLFDSLRDTEGSGIQVQFAKQWLYGHCSAAFENTDFNPQRDLAPGADELDIFTLVLVSHMTEMDQRGEGLGGRGLEVDEVQQLNETIQGFEQKLARMMHTQNVSLQQQQANQQENQLMQALLVLDRMGLLKGNLPKTPAELAGMLEVNRESFQELSTMLQRHQKAEKERADQFRRDQLRNMQRTY